MQRALFGWERHLLVDRIVVKADMRGVLAVVAKKDRRNSRPKNRGQTHGAGLATGVEDTIAEPKGEKFAARVADRGDLGVRGGIVGGGDEVLAPADDFILSHDDTTEGAAPALGRAVVGQPDGFTHEMLVAHGAAEGMLIVTLRSYKRYGENLGRGEEAVC